MAISQKLSARQNQKLALTQQMLQSIEFLQLSNLELSERISRELVENPILEEIEDAAADFNRDQDVEKSVNQNLSGDESDFDEREQKTADYADSSDTGYTDERDGDKKRNSMENFVAHEETLSEHLLRQAGAAAEGENELLLYQKIITSLDENGFFSGYGELADENSEKVQRIISAIQLFDPVGCAAKDVRESLLIQAKHYFPSENVIADILESFFSDLEKLNYKKIARGLNLPVSLLIEKCRILKGLNPFPGRQYSGKVTGYITPDVDVRVVDGEIIVTLNDEWIPKIRINSYYVSLLRKKSIEKNLRDFIQDRMISAKNLIRNISGRRETIVKVARALMDCQRDFLLRGPGHLKPLTHQSIARSTELSESTISRVTSNKYVQTCWGVCSMKDFFTAKMKSVNSAVRSSDQVMKLIGDIIEREKKDAPLSDEEIVKILAKADIHAARRTIAKYRDILHIPSSSKRKKINMIKKEERP